MIYKIGPTPESKPEPEVTLTFKTEDRTGHVAVCANGVEILWLRTEGRIQRNSMDATALQKLGYELNSIGRVKLMSEGE